MLYLVFLMTYEGIAILEMPKKSYITRAFYLYNRIKHRRKSFIYFLNFFNLFSNICFIFIFFYIYNIIEIEILLELDQLNTCICQIIFLIVNPCLVNLRFLH